MARASRSLNYILLEHLIQQRLHLGGAEYGRLVAKLVWHLRCECCDSACLSSPGHCWNLQKYRHIYMLKGECRTVPSAPYSQSRTLCLHESMEHLSLLLGFTNDNVNLTRYVHQLQDCHLCPLVHLDRLRSRIEETNRNLTRICVHKCSCHKNGYSLLPSSLHQPSTVTRGLPSRQTITSISLQGDI